MDNQKSQTGSGSNFGKEASGSMGKDLQKDSGNNMSSSGNNAGSSGHNTASSGNSTGSSNMGASKQLDQNKSLDQAKAEFPKAGMATAPSSGNSQSASGSSSVSNTASDAHKSIDKALDAAPQMADRLATSAHAGVDKLSGALSDARGSMDEKTKQLTEAYKNFADSGREYVRSSPATSVLVALAAGYTLSKLLGRRN